MTKPKMQKTHWETFIKVIVDRLRRNYREYGGVMRSVSDMCIKVK